MFTLQQLHTKLVKSYYRICDGKYHELEDDSYVHQHLPMHMSAALMTDQLKVLLHSLEWVKAKVNIAGPSAVLSDYIKYAYMIEGEVCVRGRKILLLCKFCKNKKSL